MKVQLLMSSYVNGNHTPAETSGYILVLKISQPTDSAFHLSIICSVVQNQEQDAS